VVTGDEIEIKFPRNWVKSVATYQRNGRKWYVHEAQSTKGFEGNEVEPVLWVSPKSGFREM
jgi:hypothetical protein